VHQRDSKSASYLYCISLAFVARRHLDCTGFGTRVACFSKKASFKGQTFSTDLDCFHAFELHSRRNAQSIPDMFASPASRVVCQMITEPDGRHYLSYFARVRFDDSKVVTGPKRFSILGHSRRRCY
jgi:hypothetical protein